MPAARNGRKDEALVLAQGESLELSRRLYDQIDRMVQIDHEGGQQANDHANALYRSARIWVVGLLGASILLGLALALTLARIVARPLNEALGVAQAVAEGDLTRRIQATTTDETGQLLHALHRMDQSLIHIVRQVRNGTDSIATASCQIASVLNGFWPINVPAHCSSVSRDPPSPIPVMPASVSTVKTLRRMRRASGATPASRRLSERSALPTRDESLASCDSSTCSRRFACCSTC